MITVQKKRTYIFIQEIFTGGKNPIFKKKDPRIRQIPFTTKKPLFSEVVRTHKELYSVTLYGMCLLKLKRKYN